MICLNLSFPREKYVEARLFIEPREDSSSYARNRLLTALEYLL